MEKKKVNILVVDDEWNMRNLIKFYLENEDWGIVEASDGEEAISSFNKMIFHLVILDIMMPRMDGWEVCSYIRKRSQVPILMLTAINETKDKVYGLNLGADDYLTKPFDKDEFLARVNALLRRGISFQIKEKSEGTIELQDIRIVLISREVTVHESVVPLTPKEFDVLYILAQNPNQAFSRELLLDKIWGPDFFGDFRTVDQHVKNIREKVKKAGASYNPIQTVWGVGYKLQGKKTDE